MYETAKVKLVNCCLTQSDHNNPSRNLACILSSYEAIFNSPQLHLGNTPVHPKAPPGVPGWIPAGIAAGAEGSSSRALFGACPAQPEPGAIRGQ